MKIGTLVTCLAAALAATVSMTGIARAADALTATKQVESGFLADYARLEKKGLPGDQYLIYTDPAFGAPAGKAVYLVPAAPFPADTKFVDVDPAVITGALAALDGELSKRIGSGWRLVPSASAADLVLQVVLTQVVAEAQGVKPRDFIPARAVTNVVKDAAMGDALVAAASLEARLTDARTGRVLAEFLQHSPGKGIGRSKDEDTRVTLKALQPAIEDSAKLVAERVMPQG